jgi:hypothetical protein
VALSSALNGIPRFPGTPSLRTRIANFGEQGYTRWTMRPLRAAQGAKGGCCNGG